MRIFLTEIQAIDPKDGQMKVWAGPNIEAISKKDAIKRLNDNGLGYCKVIGVLVAEMNEDLTGYIDYQNPKLN